MQDTIERGCVSLPADVVTALRERIRKTEGPEIADAPLALLLRYIAALHAGMPREQAVRYSRPLPRGKTWHTRSIPDVQKFGSILKGD